MPDNLSIPPFNVVTSDGELTFRFAVDAFETGWEYPPDLEGMIAAVTLEQPDWVGQRRVCIDLADLPAVSSKQLGAMLAVRKGCGVEGKVLIRGLRPNVRELLHITRLDDFFELE